MPSAWDDLDKAVSVKGEQVTLKSPLFVAAFLLLCLAVFDAAYGSLGQGSFLPWSVPWWSVFGVLGAVSALLWYLMNRKAINASWRHGIERIIKGE